MALKGYFFDNKVVDGQNDREYSASDFTKYLEKIVGSGVFPNPSNNLQVVAGSGMQIIVKKGQAFINGHKIVLDSDMTITLNPADVTLDRIDRIVVRINTLLRIPEIIAKQGDNASRPVAPNIVRDSTYLEYCLAEIYIENNIKQISQSKIKDTRPDSSICGWVQGLVQQVDTSQLYKQWQTAYEQFYDKSEKEFEEWFLQVQSDLSKLAPLTVLKSTAKATEKNQTLFLIGIDEYTKGLDILNVYINGFKLIEGVDYRNGLTNMTILLTKGVAEGTTINFEVVKASGDDYQQQIDDVKADIVDLKLLTGSYEFDDNDIYGVEVDFENNRFTRIGASANFTEGEDFDSINAYNRRRCVLSDTGEVITYHGADGYIEDGSKGQVMVEQPKFYYKVVPLKLEPIADGEGYHLRKARYYICDIEKPGFKVHPAFIQNGVEKDKIYLSAYEGSIYDASSGEYLLEDEQVADFSTDKLSSIANAKPCSGQTQQLTRANSRILANNRGNGWGISTIQSISCTQLLFLIEYAGFNSQTLLGAGIVDKPTLYDKNYAENTGLTSSLGNTSGVGEKNSISYRGEENVWGNIWNMISDQFKIENPSKFVSGMTSTIKINNQDIGFSVPYCTNSFISSFGYSKEYDWLFIPTEFKGNSNLPVGDMAINNRGGVCVYLYSGGWYSSTNAGMFIASMYTPLSAKDITTNARLTYVSQ